MNLLNIIISIGMILGVLLIISGHKEKFTIMNMETKLSPSKITNPPNFKLEKKIYKPKKDCNPEFDCRRVGFYCSNIN